MIDWLNLWIGIMFGFAGISLIISACKYYLPYFYRFLLVVIIGVAFIATGVGFILNSPITFDSALHECTEWELNDMPRKGWTLSLVGENFDYLGSDEFLSDKNPNKKCRVVYEESKVYASSRDIVACEKMNMFSCVSFHAKTECEKGNPKYVLEKGTERFLSNTTFIDGYDFICENCTDEEQLKKGEEGLSNIYRYVSYGYSSDVCRKKSVEELEADYCKENPESDKCYCLEEIKESDGWSVCYPDKTGKFDFSNNLSNCEEQFKEYCVSAVPVSEKTFCDENPTDTERCDCITKINKKIDSILGLTDYARMKLQEHVINHNGAAHVDVMIDEILNQCEAWGEVEFACVDLHHSNKGEWKESCITFEDADNVCVEVATRTESACVRAEPKVTG